MTVRVSLSLALFYLCGSSQGVKHNYHDRLEAFIVSKNEYCAWISNDSFGIRILSQCEDWTCFHPEKDVSIIYVNGKRYKIVEAFCKEDDQLAYDYGFVDKYFRHTFYDMDGNELSSYYTEA